MLSLRQLPSILKSVRMVLFSEVSMSIRSCLSNRGTVSGTKGFVEGGQFAIISEEARVLGLCYTENVAVILCNIISCISFGFVLGTLELLKLTLQTARMLMISKRLSKGNWCL